MAVSEVGKWQKAMLYWYGIMMACSEGLEVETKMR